MSAKIRRKVGAAVALMTAATAVAVAPGTPALANIIPKMCQTVSVDCRYTGWYRDNANNRNVKFTIYFDLSNKCTFFDTLLAFEYGGDSAKAGLRSCTFAASDTGMYFDLNDLTRGVGATYYASANSSPDCFVGVASNNSRNWSWIAIKGTNDTFSGSYQC